MSTVGRSLKSQFGPPKWHFAKNDGKGSACLTASILVDHRQTVPRDATFCRTCQRLGEPPWEDAQFEWNDEVSPTPWSFHKGDLYDADGEIVRFDSDENLEFILKAVNLYHYLKGQVQ